MKDFVQTLRFMLVGILLVVLFPFLMLAFLGKTAVEVNQERNKDAKKT